jgi:hypothetical protein
MKATLSRSLSNINSFTHSFFYPRYERGLNQQRLMKEVYQFLHNVIGSAPLKNAEKGFYE